MDTKQYLSSRFSPVPGENILNGLSRDDIYRIFVDLGLKKGAEIGVLRGWNALHMCKIIPGLELLCVDPWRRYSGHRRGRSTQEQEQCYQSAISTLSAYNVQIVRSLSLDAAPLVRDGSLDFVYIDAHHAFDFVMQDIIVWARKVRPGGIVAGHDYLYHPDPSKSGVVEAVDAYLSGHRIPEFFLVDTGTSSPSWFFVKD